MIIHRSWVRAPPAFFSFSDVGDTFGSWPRRMIYPYTFELAGATRLVYFLINFNMYTSHVLNATIITHNTRCLGLIKEKDKAVAGREPTI